MARAGGLGKTAVEAQRSRAVEVFFDQVEGEATKAVADSTKTGRELCPHRRVEIFWFLQNVEPANAELAGLAGVTGERRSQVLDFLHVRTGRGIAGGLIKNNHCIEQTMAVSLASGISTARGAPCGVGTRSCLFKQAEDFLQDQRFGGVIRQAVYVAVVVVIISHRGCHVKDEKGAGFPGMPGKKVLQNALDRGPLAIGKVHRSEKCEDRTKNPESRTGAGPQVFHPLQKLFAGSLA